MNSSAIDVDLPPSVTLAAGAGNLPVLRVATAIATAEVYLHGAHVAAWAPAGEQPVIWLSGQADFGPGKAIRGGVPVCFPWFGAGRKPGLAPPAHGFARLATWRLIGADDDDGIVTLTLRLTAADVVDLDAAKAWPHEFEATYTVRIGRELGLTLTVRNAGQEEFSYEEALHTYFAVSDIRTTRVLGLDGVQYLDTVHGADPGPVTQSGAVTFDAETDRIYSSTGTTTLDDAAGGRSITAVKENSAQTVVWNPWIDKSAAMSDFGDDEWQGMVCIEAVNANDEAVSLVPGASHTMGATYTVSRD